MGNSDGVITMPDGSHIVPHPPSGRIQVYDDRWRFVRGWPVKAGGGDFTLFPSRPDRVEMISTRGSGRYTYLLSGDLVARETYPAARFSSFPNQGKGSVVPTVPWLWIVSSPAFPSGSRRWGSLLLRLSTGWRGGRRRSDRLRHIFHVPRSLDTNLV